MRGIIFMGDSELSNAEIGRGGTVVVGGGVGAAYCWVVVAIKHKLIIN